METQPIIGHAAAEPAALPPPQPASAFQTFNAKPIPSMTIKIHMQLFIRLLLFFGAYLNESSLIPI